ncbi:MAG: hypothetical protein COS34_10440, partial [Lysobacterales bacterium CG02_land_8_20_14_3_00_62_12]
LCATKQTGQKTSKMAPLMIYNALDPLPALPARRRYQAPAEPIRRGAVKSMMPKRAYHRRTATAVLSADPKDA